MSSRERCKGGRAVSTKDIDVGVAVAKAFIDAQDLLFLLQHTGV